MPNRRCGRWLYFNSETGECQRFFCGEATCERPECHKRFWLARVHLISDLMQEYGLDKFFTLTMTREMPVDDTWIVIADVWHKFLTMTRRTFPKYPVEPPKARKERILWKLDKKTWHKEHPMWFVAVLESHEDGYPHVHGFTNLWIPQEWYSEKFAACGGGKIAWVERVKCTSSGEAADYVCKKLGRYVGKQNLIDGKIKRGKGKRTIWRSAGMKTAKEMAGSSGKWEVMQGNFFDNDGMALYTVEQIEDGFVVKGVTIDKEDEKIMLWMKEDDYYAT